MQKIVLLFSLTSLLIACGPVATFKEAQPVDVENIASMPKKLIGKYTNPDNNSVLIITPNSITNLSTLEYKIHKNEIDSTFKIFKDSILLTKSNEKFRYKLVGDSLELSQSMINILYQPNKNFILKKFKGYYFLSQQISSTNWEVKKLQLKRGKLILSQISTLQEIETLQEITESKEDTVAPFKFTPTKKQFKEFIKKDGFTADEVFVKVRK